MTGNFFADLWTGLLPILQVIGSSTFLYSVLRLTTPILFATMAALVSDRAGVTNISIEGAMLFAALMGVVGSAYAQSCWVGLLVAIAAGVVFSLLLAFFHLWLKTNLVLTCIALNSLSSGLTIFILYMLTGDRGVSTALHSINMPKVNIPLLKDIPFLGEVLSGHNVLTYMAIIVVVLVAILLYKTKLGIYIRAVGESPKAIETAGFSSRRIRLYALIISGVIAGMGGVDGVCIRLHEGYGIRTRLYCTGGGSNGLRKAAAVLAGSIAVRFHRFTGEQSSGAWIVQRPRPNVPVCDHDRGIVDLRPLIIATHSITEI